MKLKRTIVALLLCAVLVVPTACSDSAVTQQPTNMEQTEVAQAEEQVLENVDSEEKILIHSTADESVDANLKLDTDYINGASSVKEQIDDVNEAEDVISSIIESNVNKNDRLEDSKKTDPTEDKENLPFDQKNPDAFQSEDVEYADNTILVKFKKSFNGEVTDELKQAGVGKLDYMFALSDSVWYTAYLYKDTDVNQVIEDVREMDSVVLAEYNYKYETTSVENVTLNTLVAENPQANAQTNLKTSGIHGAWDFMTKAGKNAGGSSAVTVAVIDTGVDYNHVDLKANIWTNVDEIPDNNIDDDGNGYIDDYYGIDMTAKKGSANDDNGHGTHVAGIIAAANNKEGIVGIAYNTKIMPIKAGDASGFFQQSDIAKAIIYAYEEGADVINMSFGGTASSIAVQDALEIAYSRCVLVASAGNRGVPNEESDYYSPEPNYPAAYSFVLGVMSVDDNNVEASYTNWDAILYNVFEYEVYAPGNQVLSTIPGDRYATLSGTSMAAPVVSAQAAILRSYYSDRNTYSTRFIYGQIVGTADEVMCCNPQMHTVMGMPHNVPGSINLYRSLVELPTPDIGISDYTLFDTETYEADEKGITTGLTSKNNGDGVVDAGEVIALGFTLKNRWGMGEDTIVSIDSTNDLGVKNPYVTFLNNDINYGSVGTYSENDCGKIKEDNLWTGWENPFYVQISNDCPNNYSVTLDVTITSKNGLDETDDTIYTKKCSITLIVRRGVVVGSRIEEDTTWTKDNYYILSNALTIAEGATLTIEEGTKVQFWCSDASDPYADTGIVYLNVEGKLIAEGTEENPVEMFPSDWMSTYEVKIQTINGYSELNFTNVVNGHLNISKAVNCEFTNNYDAPLYYRYLNGGVVETRFSDNISYLIDDAINCAFYKVYGTPAGKIFDGCIFVDCHMKFSPTGTIYKDCVFYGNNNTWSATLEPKNSEMTIGINGTTITTDQVIYSPETGTTYIVLDLGTTNMFWLSGSGTTVYRNIHLANFFAETIGGNLASFETIDEYNFVTDKISYKGDSYAYFSGMYKDSLTGKYLNHNGSEYPVEVISTINNPYAEEYYYGYITSSKSTYTADQWLYVTHYIIEVPGQIQICGIELDEYVVNLDIASSYQIMADVTPTTATKADLIYESQNESIVTVDENGKITPVATGTTEIRVYAPDYAVYNYVTVNVVDTVTLESIAFVKDDITLNVGEQQKVKVEFIPANTTKRTLSYESSDTSIATVDKNGYITAHTEGEVVITVTGYDGYQDTLTVHCVIPAAEINFADAVYMTSLEKEDGKSFYPLITPSNATNQTLTWESSNPEICYVDESGALVKLQEGNATLKATLTGTELSAEVIIVISENEGIPHVIEMKKNKNTDNMIYALTDAGDLWTWGNSSVSPIKLSVDDVKDFAMTSNYHIILDSSGTLTNYYSKDECGLDSLTKRFTYSSLTNVKSMDFYRYSIYAICEDGSAWEVNRVSDTASQIEINEAVKKVVVNSQGAIFLTETGNVFLTTDSSNAEIIAADVIDIDSDDFSRFVLYKKSDVWLVNNMQIESVAYTGNERYFANGWYYFDDDRVYIKGSNNSGELGVGTTVVVSDYQEMLNILKPESLFVLDKNIYVQTQDGKFYGCGSGNKHFLATNSVANVNVPIRIIVGIVDSGTELEGIVTNSFVNVDENNIVEDTSIVIDYNGSINKGMNYGSITLTTENGALIGINKTLDLDKMTIKPTATLTDGATYTLTIPAAALSGNDGKGNIEYIFTFLYQSSDENNNETTNDDDLATEDKLPVEIHTTIVDEGKYADRYITAEMVDAWLSEHIESGVDHRFYSNVILNRLDADSDTWLRVVGASGGYASVKLSGNYWGTTNETLINEQILDYDDYQSLIDIDPGEYLTEAPSNTFPFVVDAYLTVEGEQVDTVGNEEVTFVVNFNRPMDTSIDLNVAFGSAYPYADYTVSGEYVSPTQWQGTMKLTTLIENGYQYWCVRDGKAAGTSLKLYEDWGRFPFKIDTSAAQALIMQAVVEENGIQLTWTQDEYETLAGYNVYRSTSEDGLYERLNNTVIPADTKEWFDNEIDPGVTYYYNFTVVDSDLNESEPSGKVTATAMDTLAPDIYHSPVRNAFTGSNLVISASVTDNVGIYAATLYYRTTGEEEWKSLVMTNNNDKYSAVISADDISTAGLEYYIAAYDGVSYTYKGTAEEPYSVIVQVAVSDNALGDVDGNGAIELKDAMMLLMAINDRLNLTAEQFARADINGSGDLEALEALRIMQYVNGKISSVLF